MFVVILLWSTYHMLHREQFGWHLGTEYQPEANWLNASVGQIHLLPLLFPRSPLPCPTGASCPRLCRLWYSLWSVKKKKGSRFTTVGIALKRNKWKELHRVGIYWDCVHLRRDNQKIKKWTWSFLWRSGFLDINFCYLNVIFKGVKRLDENTGVLKLMHRKWTVLKMDNYFCLWFVCNSPRLINHMDLYSKHHPPITIHQYIGVRI